MFSPETFISPILLRGDASTAYRDPAACFHNGTFYLYFTLVETEQDGKVYEYLAMTSSRDLKTFAPVKKLSPRDQSKNFSSPGNVIEHGGAFYLCCQTYCRENGEKFGNANSRIWLMRSEDLENWEPPRLLRVKGPETPPEDMGRMIDPYLVRSPGGDWFCFYKQNGVSFSRSKDLITWEFCGHTDCGENVCILQNKDHYLLWHSPPNGIGVKKSSDLLHWQDSGELITLGQKHWPWAQGRLTAGMVLDLRNERSVGNAIMFFHGTGPEDERTVFDQYACIGFAWSSDLSTWHWVK